MRNKRIVIVLQFLCLVAWIIGGWRYIEKERMTHPDTFNLMIPLMLAVWVLVLFIIHEGFNRLRDKVK